MQTVVKEFDALKQHADTIQNDAEHTLTTLSPGDGWTQGDIFIMSLSAVPAGATKINKPGKQLAPGTTQGSRHCLRYIHGITLYTVQGATVLDGPIIDAPKGCAIDHPEHGNVVLPSGVYAIVYQRAFADKPRRVQD